MKRNTIIAGLLIVFGVVAFTYQFTYKSREKTVDLGSLQVTSEKTKNIPIPPIIGVIAIVSGIVLLARAGKKD